VFREGVGSGHPLSSERTGDRRSVSVAVSFRKGLLDDIRLYDRAVRR
jgi:hypothetical protein